MLALETNAVRCAGSNPAMGNYHISEVAQLARALDCDSSDTGSIPVYRIDLF